MAVQAGLIVTPPVFAFTVEVARIGRAHIFDPGKRHIPFRLNSSEAGLQGGEGVGGLDAKRVSVLRPWLCGTPHPIATDMAQFVYQFLNITHADLP